MFWVNALAGVEWKHIIRKQLLWEQHTQNIVIAFQKLAIFGFNKKVTLDVCERVLGLRSAILARCRRLTQDILLRGLGVFSTTMKLTGRPDLQKQRHTHINDLVEPVYSYSEQQSQPSFIHVLHIQPSI